MEKTTKEQDLEITTSEYRVRPVTRYVVTRYRSYSRPVDGDPTRCAGGSGSECLGEFDNADTAYAVGYALANSEQRERGLAPGDPRVVFPLQTNENASNAA